MTLVNRSEKVQGEWIKRKDSSLLHELIWVAELLQRQHQARIFLFKSDCFIVFSKKKIGVILIKNTRKANTNSYL